MTPEQKLKAIVEYLERNAKRAAVANGFIPAEPADYAEKLINAALARERDARAHEAMNILSVVKHILKS